MANTSSVNMSSDEDDDVARTPDFLLNFVDSEEPPESDSDSDSVLSTTFEDYAFHPFLDEEAVDDDDCQ